MKNKLALFGFVSLLGFLGVFTENHWYLGYFGFLVFFRYLTVIPDELFYANVRKAGSYAFFTGFTAEVIILLICLFFFQVNQAAVFGAVLGSAIALIVFTFSFSHFENMERKGLPE